MNKETNSRRAFFGKLAALIAAPAVLANIEIDQKPENLYGNARDSKFSGSSGIDIDIDFANTSGYNFLYGKKGLNRKA